MEAGHRRGDVAMMPWLLATGLALLAVAAFAWYRRSVASPIRDYIGALTKEGTEIGYPELAPRGSRDLIALAEAINMRRAERISFETALRDSELRLRTNLNMMPLAAIEVDSAGRILRWNRAAELIFGHEEAEALGSDLVDLIVPELLRPEIRELIERLNLGDVTSVHVNRNVSKEGREMVCEWHNAPLYDTGGEWIGWSSIVRDITEQEAEAEKLLYLSRHDPLTGLLNRRSMRERLEEERLRCRRTGGSYATIMLDIDWFKRINDRYGHEGGDVVLKEMATLMSETVRSTDWVGRWGGEEFLILLPETAAEGGVGLAEKIRSRIAEKAIAYGNRAISVTITAGVAACLDPEETIDGCVRRADEALLAGKGSGRDRVVVAP
jgi:diguanylate cyclase (GGDEF)-like protein/PAS domain S-box-containing protein